MKKILTKLGYCLALLLVVLTISNKPFIHNQAKSSDNTYTINDDRTWYIEPL
ncbi:MAG: hypothetical protein ACFWTJ_05550 [Lachnoclostridium sp.]|jgi:hypothetical protein